MRTAPWWDWGQLFLGSCLSCNWQLLFYNAALRRCRCRSVGDCTFPVWFWLCRSPLSVLACLLCWTASALFVPTQISGNRRRRDRHPAGGELKTPPAAPVNITGRAPEREAKETLRLTPRQGQPANQSTGVYGKPACLNADAGATWPSSGSFFLCFPRARAPVIGACCTAYKARILFLSHPL